MRLKMTIIRIWIKNQSISTLRTYRTKNILKLYPVKKFTVLIFNPYPNNYHF